MAKPRKQSQLKRVLIVPDCHVPYHDKRAFNLMLKVATELPPDIIISIGDFADFFSISRHSKDPRRRFRFKEELEEVSRELSRVDDLGAKEKYYIAGNHEDRMDRYINEVAPEFSRMFDIPEVLRLEQRGWKYVPYKDDVKVGKLNATHDVGTFGMNATRTALAAYHGNVVTGHTHRLMYHIEGNMKGEPHVSASFGWLGDRKEIDYMHRVKAARDWALGFGWGHMRADGTIYLAPIPIVHYTCVVEGRYFEA